MSEEQQQQQQQQQPEIEQQPTNSDVCPDPAAMINALLTQMQNNFEQMSNTILGRIDEMGSRIDELEGTISELAKRAGVDMTQVNLPESK